MKTYILQLEAHDDIISTRDKLGWAKSGRILLVWPERGRVLHRRLDLELLKRHSQMVGAQLALVTKDPDVRYYAVRLGIPVFKSLRKAQSDRWRLPRRFRNLEADNNKKSLIERREPGSTDPSRPGGKIPLSPAAPAPKLNPLTRLVFFTLGVAALLSIAATLIPSAQVVLIPKSEAQTTTIEVSADPTGSRYKYFRSDSGQGSIGCRRR